MTTVRGFRGYTVRPELAPKLMAPAYDVVSFEEAKALADKNEYSFFRVSRSEIEFPEGFDCYNQAVYEKGRDNLNNFINKGYIVQDADPILYVYAQKMGDRIQYGIMAEASLEEYEKGIIKKHELTRPKKEEDRMKTILTQNSHAEPVFFTYNPVKEIDDIVAQVTKRPPHYDFVATCDEGVQHICWKMTPEETKIVEQLFKTKVPVMYIADGHHRTAASYNLYKKSKEEHAKAGIPVKGDEDFCFLMTLIYPCDQVKIWEYNRVLKTIDPKTPQQVIEELSVSFDIKKIADTTDPRPKKKGEFSLLMDKTWFTMEPKETIKAATSVDVLSALDSEILTKYALKPVFNIHDIRTDERIDFVGGVRGTKELEVRCETDCKAAFALYPVDVREVMAIADANLIMPPKSTWFAPKPLSGGIVRMLRSSAPSKDKMIPE